MEELRSTEVLDREILEDARKKAFKILKTADDSVQSQARRWEKNTQKAVAEIRKTYEAKTARVRDEILARGPLDKRRLRSETAESSLRQAMNGFLQSLDRSRLLLILERELEERLAECCYGEISAGETPEISCRNLEEAEAEALLKAVLGRLESAESRLFKSWRYAPAAASSASTFPGLTVNTQTMRINASVENAALKLLAEKRAELASCLLGEGALND